MLTRRVCPFVEIIKPSILCLVEATHNLQLTPTRRARGSLYEANYSICYPFYKGADPTGHVLFSTQFFCSYNSLK
jgi:hypothetical protein